MNVAIVPAAGSGRRMGADRAKQFLELDGEPILVHTLRRFEACSVIDRVVVVLPESALDWFRAVAERAELRKVERVVPGGAERRDSVALGLATLEPSASGIVVVHDGVRPFVTPTQIARVVELAETAGAAILGQSAVDTVKEVDDGMIVRTLDRSRIVLAQTPQAFRVELLRAAYDAWRREQWPATDDASLVERLGHRVALVHGSAINIKITRPEDLPLAKLLLSRWEA